MRLLRSDKLELVNFPGQDTPPFAILSHTWDEGEVLFQDIQKGTATSRRGIRKVLGACAQAREDGFEYIWIDTCCIDKTSSAELSEAINSMYQWYSDADVCYALLSDVDGSEDPYMQDSSFSKSRWFTRGWTLQELIAPPIVIFYDSDWARIGSKSQLQEIVVKITGISAVYFETMDLSQFSAAQKMSWAANRDTTRVEDTAYCLLGLFSINMPLLYGEGSNAFIRLQEEILRQSEDDSLLCRADLTSGEERPLFAESPAVFEACGNIMKQDTQAYRRVPSLLLQRGHVINKMTIEMTFMMVNNTEILLNCSKTTNPVRQHCS
ncbi:heterokaryon incompatibility protein-domain-containing protein [Cladorrhinum sp. PSN259]|nr:heterokaryon incompatibility protein-domain-containing protein [Cladorrhinum sp. PSN259]